MKVQTYARLLLRRGWMLAAVSLLTALSAVALAELQQPTYRSRAILQVVPARPGDYGNALAANQMLRVLSFQATTTRMAQQVSGQLQLDVPPQRLLTHVHTAAEADGLRITIEVDWPDPLVARAIAQAFAENFVQEMEARNAQVDTRDRLDVNILEPAPEGWVHWPRTRPLAAAGLFFGALLGAALLFILELLDSAYVRFPQEAFELVGAPVLAAIPAHPSPTPVQAHSGQRRWWQVWRSA